ncbi:MAG: HAMP domain-containing histidine kinase [Clostridiales bacterium]|jgi:signal transduction histidine kinase|nr:HAMP domain-containing histidine kinase [Clostridiales bacterium]
MHDEQHNPLKIIGGFSVVLIALGSFFALGHIIISRFFDNTGTLLAAVVSGLTGVILLGFFIWILTLIHALKYKEHTRMIIRLQSQMLDALAEIARGNFNVLLAPEEHNPLGEIVDAINKMAKDLGSLETMRQDFISNVSHEIQSPLTSIGGFAALLKNAALSAEERRHYAEIIEAESRRLSSLSDNLLKLSALDTEKKPLVMQMFRLDKQLEKIALTLEPQWSAKSLNLEADLVKCEYRGDEALLSQMWVNLLHNAIKFTPDGGDIRIALTESDGAVTVTVADSGIGIADEDKPRIFERFYKADKSRDRALGGNGLGLSLVKKIAELHSGSVSVDSEIGKGSTFKITLC